MTDNIYVGIAADLGRTVFTFETEPTHDTHGAQYVAVIGPFRSRFAAQLCADYGQGNPHMQTVADVERLAKRALARAAAARRIRK